MGEVRLVNSKLSIAYSAAKDALADRGAYLLLAQLDRDCLLEIGALGALTFKKGYYVYVGSARKNLESRLARHHRRRKKMHWHIDYLLTRVDRLRSFPIRTPRNIECLLAADLAGMADHGVARFGSSDCRCPAHLFFFLHNPLLQADFVRTILRYRHSIAQPMTSSS